MTVSPPPTSPICWSRLPDRFADGRHEAIERGFAKAGYTVRRAMPDAVSPSDVLVSWNAYGNNEAVGSAVGRHVVAEEAYIREIGGERYFALGLNGHNGCGVHPIDGSERWEHWKIPIAPWRKTGAHILVCGQRGFGYNAMAMPDDWPDRVLTEIRARTDRPVWFRPHPKRRRRLPSAGYDRILDFREPLARHLKDCWAVVVWTSNVATEALLAGVPVFFCGPNIVTHCAAEQGLEGLERPAYPDRLLAFTRLAWSQYSLSEIESGWAIKTVLRSPRSRSGSIAKTARTESSSI